MGKHTICETNDQLAFQPSLLLLLRIVLLICNTVRNVCMFLKLKTFVSNLLVTPKVRLHLYAYYCCMQFSLKFVHNHNNDKKR